MLQKHFPNRNTYRIIIIQYLDLDNKATKLLALPVGIGYSRKLFAISDVRPALNQRLQPESAHQLHSVRSALATRIGPPVAYQCWISIALPKVVRCLLGRHYTSLGQRLSFNTDLPQVCQHGHANWVYIYICVCRNGLVTGP